MKAIMFLGTSVGRLRVTAPLGTVITVSVDPYDDLKVHENISCLFFTRL